MQTVGRLGNGHDEKVATNVSYITNTDNHLPKIEGS
jgi:hypothetical protein